MKTTAYILSAVIVLLLACKTKDAPIVKGGSKQADNDKKGSTGQRAPLLNQNAFLITKTTNDKTYAYSPKNPVKVGGVVDSEGPLNERRFINGLRGPKGEVLQFTRSGSCCSFNTPNGFINNTGLLDHYLIYWDGCKDTLDIYINMYDFGELYVPVGLKARE